MHPLGVHLQVVSMANSGKNSNTSGSSSLWRRRRSAMESM